MKLACILVKWLRTFSFQICLLFCICLLLGNCQDSPGKEIIFIGDSIVARWDIDEAFPAYTVQNYGVGGSGVRYLEEMAGKCANRTAIVLSGTNDLYHLKNNDNKIKDYAARFIRALENLKADNVVVISILPREFHNEDSLLSTIESLNNALAIEISKKSNMRFVDVYPQFLYGEKIDYDLFEDNLHLSPQGYQVLNINLGKIICHEDI